MALPLMMVGALAKRFAPRILGAGRRVAAGGVRRLAGAAAPRLRAALGAPGRRRRGRIPSLSATEMGKLMFMAQILGKRSPAMTMIVMKALGGRI